MNNTLRKSGAMLAASGALLIALVERAGAQMTSTSSTATAMPMEPNSLVGPYLYLAILAGGGILAIIVATAADKGARSRGR